MTESPLPTFAPVPTRARHDGWSPERQHLFVQALARLGAVEASARVVGMSPRSAYSLRKRAGEDSEFARAWDAALSRSYHDAVDALLPVALHGERIPVFYSGRQVAEYRRYDTRAALTILRARAARGGRGDKEC